MTENTSDLRFARLTEIAPEVIVDHMSDPRMAAHMPLLVGMTWNEAAALAFVAAKEACWQRDGLGHWAFVHRGSYVGWGGFQREGDEWDFGLVLTPGSFGIGPRIAQKALAYARSDERIPYVTFLLPPSRRHLRPLDRLGAEAVGEVSYEGHTFLKFRLDTTRPDAGTEKGGA